MLVARAGTEPCNPVYEDDDCACIVDGNPQSPLHFLVFPKDKSNLIHLSTAGILQEKLLGHMILVAKVCIILLLVIFENILHTDHHYCARIYMLHAPQKRKHK
jgi:histidine triad (HIT) family protein